MQIQSEVVSQAFEYSDGTRTFEAHVSFPREARALVPVIVLPDWHGNGTFAAAVADRLARMGFFAFCVDMFGKGVRPATAEDAAKKVMDLMSGM